MVVQSDGPANAGGFHYCQVCGRSGAYQGLSLIHILKEIGLSLIAKVPVMVAYYYRLCQGLGLPPVREDLSEAEHFLWLLKGEEPDQDEAHILEVAYILHADPPERGRCV